MSTQLRSERLALRPIARTDAEALLAILLEPEVARWWRNYDAEKVRRDFFDDADTTVFAIELEDDVVGLIQYSEENEPSYRHAGIDVFLSHAHHGRGLGTEAVRTLARHLFEERGHHRLIIDPTVGNDGAIRCYEKVGFRAVGVMRGYVRRSDRSGWDDGLLMDMLADELT